ncbi:radical SAM protein [candidate division KSB1 bacterium]
MIWQPQSIYFIIIHEGIIGRRRRRLVCFVSIGGREDAVLPFESVYIRTHRSGRLTEKAILAENSLRDCALCPNNCRVNRIDGEIGDCKASAQMVVSGISPHFGEEPPLVGFSGSGTIFFSHCNLACIFCQNYSISHQGDGVVMSPEGLARGMLKLQEMGCHNVNLVTPTPHLAGILRAVNLAVADGLSVPIVYNCGGYESVEALKLMDGVVDIYMPDFKYGNNRVGESYSGVPDYFDRAREAFLEMQRQVGVLETDDRGIAVRGLLIRHLVLPGDAAGSEAVCRFIASELSKESHVNMMDQYRPCYQADKVPELNRPISREEYRRAVTVAGRFGLHRGFEHA